MKQILIALLATVFLGTAFAEAKIKEVCKDKTDKAGKVINGKDGKPTQVCRKIKVHKKLEGTEVPVKK